MGTATSNNDTQQHPANPGLSAVVSASAGTGKTYLLVTRIIRLLLAGGKPEGILALTFTRKAAAEMRERLFARLAELALLDDDDLLHALINIKISKPEQYLQSARSLYEQLLYAEQGPRITTFHAFCQELLRRFPLEAEVPAGYELLQTTALLEDIAWDALCRQATKHPNSECAQALSVLFTACGGLYNTRQALQRGFLDHRSDWWAFTEESRDPVATACSHLHQQLKPKSNPLNDFFNASCHDNLIRYSQLLGQHATSTNLNRCDIIQQALSDELSLAQRFALVQSAFLTQTGQARQLKATNALEQKIGSQNQETLLSLHQQLVESVLATQEECRRLHNYDVSCAWYRAGQQLLDHYQTIKQKQCLLDFSDLEWQCYRLLSASDQAQWVQYKLDQRIDHLLLDEFQDTNPTQWQLILPILEEMAGGLTTERPRSVFLVGDTKQSIYRFRRANPHLQITANHWLTQHLDACQFPLSKSWRSAPAIIDFLNAVFNQSSPYSQFLRYEQHSTYKNTLWGQVTLLPANITETNTCAETSSLRDPLTQARPENLNIAHYQEGLQIARCIQELVAEKRGIGEDNSPVNYDDILILLRRRTHAHHYEQALLETGIPFIGAEKGGLLECLEIQDIEALLNVLMTPFDNLTLAQVLRSPIISASDIDLQSITKAGGKNWYEKLLVLAQAPDTSPALQRAAKLLPAWRELLAQLPTHDLIDRIYYEGDIIRRYREATAPTLQARVTANLQYLLEIALEIDSGRFPSLMRFLQHLKKLRSSNRETPDNPATPHTTPKVRIMTIHAAKGLESAVVFLADCASTSKHNDAFNALVDWPTDKTRPENMLLSTRKQENSGSVQRLCERLNEEQTHEEANLLYVALSRAKQLLIISGATNSEKALEKSWYGELLRTIKTLTQENSDGCYCYQTGTISPAQHNANDKPDLVNDGDTPALPTTSVNPNRAIRPSDRDIDLESAFASSTQSNRFALRRYGDLIHKQIEQLSPPGAIKAYRADNRTDEAEWLEANDKAQKIIANPDFEFLFAPECYQQAYKEIAINYRNNEGQIVSGVIDRLVVAEKEIWIVDYKSSQADTGALEHLASRYASQLNHYGRGMEKIWPQRKIRKAILFTCAEKLIELS